MAETENSQERSNDETALLAGRYKLVEPIGEGGMGSVFLAQQTEPVKRMVAVKVIKAGMDSKAVLARFEAERQALAMMDHPNIAKVLDAGATAEGSPFFVMELVKGVPITQFCDERKLPIRQRLELFVPVCQAIHHAHQKGIIHRDIKPSNVLVANYDDRAVPKVIDFGVAKATGQTLTDMTLNTGFGVVGTPEYMSPEQADISSMDIDTRSDVYSLGVLLYELLTGSTPVDRKSLGKAALFEILRIVREVEAPRPSAKLSTIDTLSKVAASRGTEPKSLPKLMRGELDWVVLKALEKDRTRRYDSANGFARDIERYLADEVVEARPPTVGYRLLKFVRRYKGQVIAGALVLVALVGGIVGTSMGMIQAQRANTALAEKNAQLAEEQAKVQARFELAQKAIGAFHTGISEDMLLKNDQFKILRKKLLKEAAGFYGRLEKLLEGEQDPRSRTALGHSYSELGNLTTKIGSKKEALAVHQKALAVRRELTTPDASAEVHLDLAHSLSDVGKLQFEAGDFDAAMKSFEEGREVIAALERSQDATVEMLFGMAELHLQSGMVLTATRKKEEAILAYHESLKVINRAIGIDAKAGHLRRQLANTRNNIGVVYGATGRHKEALAEYKDALKIREELLKEDPKNTALLLDVAQSHGNIGSGLGYLGQPKEQIVAFQKAKQIYQQLHDLNPAVSEYKYQLARSYGEIAYVHLHTGELKDAANGFSKAIEFQRELVEANPDVVEYRGHLARFYNNLGAVKARTDMAGSLVEFKKALSVQKEITERFPSLTRYKSELAQSYQNVGLVMRYMRDFDGAIEKYNEAIVILKKLTLDEPKHTQYQADMAGNYQNISIARKLQNRIEDSMKALTSAIEIQQTLVKKNPEVAGYKRELGRSLNTLADLYLTKEDTKTAIETYRRSRELHEAIVNQYPKVTDYRNGLGYTLSGFGRTMMTAKSHKEAVSCFRDAIAQRQRLPALSAGAQFDMASNYASLCKLCREPDSGLKPEDAEIEGQAAVTALKKALELGFRDLDSFTEDKQLDPIREREDFKKLLAEVKAKSPK